MKNRPLIWELDDDYSFYDTTNIRRHIQKAFNEWTKHIDLTFREAIADENADFHFTFMHGDGYGGVLAHAFYPWDTYRGEILFDISDKWSHR